MTTKFPDARTLNSLLVLEIPKSMLRSTPHPKHYQDFRAAADRDSRTELADALSY
jgi:hypothetical protein